MTTITNKTQASKFALIICTIAALCQAFPSSAAPAITAAAALVGWLAYASNSLEM